VRPARDHLTIPLADGRTLGYAEYGPADGLTLFAFHGLPGCRLSVPEIWNEDPSRVRVIAPDRPGVGLSSFQPHRQFTDWADDVRQLADALAVERFLAAGFSGGGPHALAVAHGLPDRVIAVGLISGGVPIDAPGSLKSMNRSNRAIFTLARRAPALMWLAAQANAYSTRRRPTKVIEKAASGKGLPDADRQAMQSPRLQAINREGGPEIYRQGVRGVLQELQMYLRPWPFDVSAIEPPVRSWHGEEDTNVPVALARKLAAQIPGSSFVTFPGGGHLIVPKHWDEILADLLVLAADG
jgi:pimeloyl-ACP methyl ester carboxylesterase